MVIKQQKDSPGLPVQTPIPMIRSEIANSTEYSLYGFSWILVKKKFGLSVYSFLISQFYTHYLYPLPSKELSRNEHELIFASKTHF